MRKILCTTDATEVSRKADQAAVEMAKAMGAELYFVHVSPVTEKDLSETGHADPTVLKEVEARDHEVLNQALEVAREAGMPDAQFVLLRSHDVARAIVEYAETHDCDHIVTGSTGRSGIPRLVLGSVSGAIIHRAHCPVTVVR